MATIGVLLGVIILWFNLRAIKNLLIEYQHYWRDKQLALKIKRRFLPRHISSEMELSGAYNDYFIRMALYFRRIAAELSKQEPGEGYTQVPEGYASLSGKWIPNVAMQDISHLCLKDLPQPRGVAITPDDLLAAYERHKPKSSFLLVRCLLVLIGLAILVPSISVMSAR